MKIILTVAFIGALACVVTASPTRQSVSSTVLRFISSVSNRFARPKVRGIEWPPPFCNSLQCPRYTVKETHDAYEVREYAASQWVTTSLKGMNYNEAIYPMFMRLFNYIRGENAARQKVAMTAPVINKIIPGQGPACESNFNMSFYVPPGSNPPKPTNPDVSLVTMPAMTVYVRSFGGWAMSYDVNKKEALALGKAINDQSKYHTDVWYTAGYDAPFKLFNRHNEIWFLAK